MWFDADGDGDQDLLATRSGGHNEGDSALADQLYINNGNGQFVRAPTEVFPEIPSSTSTAAAADFDRDGDIDVFIGGSNVTGRYPIPTASRLLENHGGVFRCATADRTPGFEKLGRVSAALWSDANGDGWFDLLIAAEWAPVRLFLNEQGLRLRDATQAAGLAGYLGWWKALAAGDVDRDGDVDFIAGNLGLNSGYRGSGDAPARLHYGDFDDSGTAEVVEGYYEAGRLLPRGSYGSLTALLPLLRRQYRTAASIASASLEEIIQLDSALMLSATQFAHGVFVNDGHGRFTFNELPRLAQAGPVNAIAAEDFDRDGAADLVLLQSAHHSGPGRPPLDGSRGLLLRGRGDGRFDAVTPAESGLHFPKSAHALSVLDVNGDGETELVICETGAPPQVHSFTRVEGR